MKQKQKESERKREEMRRIREPGEEERKDSAQTGIRIRGVRT